MPSPIINRRVIINGGPVSYNPLATAWYDAGFGITLNGSNVASQLDKSGGGFTASQATSTKQPAYTTAGINSRPSIVYTAAASPNGDFLSVNSLSTLFTGADKPLSISVVIRPTTVGINQGIFAIANSGSATQQLTFFITAANKLNYFVRDDAATTKTAAGLTNILVNTNYVLSLVSTGTVVSVWINGSLEINAADIDVGTATLDRATIGARDNNTETIHFAGQIPEAIIYNSAIDTNRRQANENYLRLKYNI